MRYSFDGFYDKCAKHGEPHGSGPNWERVVKAYHARRSQLQNVGTWRAVDAGWTVNNGTYIDPDYYIVDWEGGTG